MTDNTKVNSLGKQASKQASKSCFHQILTSGKLRSISLMNLTGNLSLILTRVQTKITTNVPYTTQKNRMDFQRIGNVTEYSVIRLIQKLRSGLKNVIERV